MNELNCELDKEYNLVVLDYNWNNKFDDLALIKDRKRCEILVNACCQPACPRRGEHYRSIGKYQIELCSLVQSGLDIGGKNIVKEPFSCQYMEYNIYKIKAFPTYISPDDIETKYVPMGYNQFKLKGRTVRDVSMLEMYIHYLVKPEHKDTVRLDVLTALTGRIKYFNVISK